MVGDRDRDSRASVDVKKAADEPRSDTTTLGQRSGPPPSLEDPDPTVPTPRMRPPARPHNDIVIDDTRLALPDTLPEGPVGDAREAEPRRRRKPLEPLVLEWVEPSLARGERVELDSENCEVRLGRADVSEIRLYTASTSRNHAVIEGNEYGEWVLTPRPGKSVKVDGFVATGAVIIEDGTNLAFGGDHLRCFAALSSRGSLSGSLDGRAEADGEEARSPERGSLRSQIESRLPGIVAAIIVVFGLGLLLWFG